MKKLIFLNLFFLSLSSVILAADTNTNIKKMQLALDKNNPESVEEIYDNNEEDLSKNWMALERLALSFERRNKFKEAVNVYRKLVSPFNLAAHKAIIDSNAQKVPENLYSGNKLPYYYYKLAFLNAQLFATSHKFVPETERTKFKKNAEGYLLLLKKVNADENDLKLVNDLILEKIKVEDQMAYKKSWYVLFDFISWQDRVYLVDNVTGTKSPLLSTAIGSSIGLGKKWSNAKYEFNIEGMYSMATSTISNIADGPTYQQSSVPVKSIILGPGMYYKAFSDKVFVGLQLPVSIRTGSWLAPDGYSLQDLKQTGAGYFFQVKFAVSGIFIQTRLGKIFPNPASHWSIGALYDF